jgi:hypothetical protein
MDKREVEYYEKNEYKRLSTSFHYSREVFSQNLKGEDTKQEDIGLSLAPTMTIAYDNVKGFDITVDGGLGVSRQVSEGVTIGAALSARRGLSGSLSLAPARINDGPSFMLPGLNWSYDPTSRIRMQPGLASLFTGTSTTISLSGTLDYDEAGTAVTLLSLGERRERRKALGYLHSYEAYMATDEDKSPDGFAMDYLVERDRQLTADEPGPLPIPSSSHDIFIVNAPGIRGSFRAHLSMPLDVRPPQTTSFIDILQVSAKAAYIASTPPSNPERIGAGMGSLLNFPTRYTYNSGGIADKTSHMVAEAKKWRNADRPLFRYFGDPGSTVAYSPTIELPHADKYGPSRVAYHPYNFGVKPSPNKLIKYRTIGELKELNRLYGATGLSRSREENLLLKRLSSNLSDEVIGEFEIVDEQGATTCFGAPTYSRTYTSRSHVTRGGVLEREASERPNARVAYRSGIPSFNDSEVGSSMSMNHTYATEWKATAIYGSNYVDVGNDGVDDKDFGGWVKFEYAKPIVNKKWRSPACGFWLNRGEVADDNDDVLAFSEGTTTHRDLRSIQTATHIAYFYTSTNPKKFADEDAPSDLNVTYPARRDAHEPLGGDAAANSTPQYTAPNRSSYLARIDLYSKDVSGLPVKLIKRIHFVYDYSLAPNNITSAMKPGNDNPGRYGKLTLRRIWEEVGDIADAKTNPIDFFYKYPNATENGILPTADRDGFKIGDLHTRYPSAFPLPDTASENPDYNVESVDTWGQISGTRPYRDPDNKHREQRIDAALQTWDQASMPDAAPWRLKTIRLSSGARIVPVYEHRKYGFVQDRMAMSFAPLVDDPAICGDISNVGPSQSLANSPNAYVVDLQKLGVPANVTSAEAYVERLRDSIVNRSVPVLFDFASSYCGDESTKTFFTRGYSSISSVELLESPQGRFLLKLKLGEMPNSAGDLSGMFGQIISKHKTSPYSTILKKYFDKYSVLCGTLSIPTPDFSKPLSLLSSVDAFVKHARSTISFQTDYERYPHTDIRRSSIRLPVWSTKTGGGPRVLKLLSFGPMTDVHVEKAELAGARYTYEHYDDEGRLESGGVATSEPIGIRNEQPFVEIFPRYYDEVKSEVFAFDKLATSETPLGESFLPRPSIGYSKVAVQGIHGAENTPGHTVHEYLTCREYPSYKLELTSAVKDADDVNPFSLPLLLPNYSSSVLKLEVSQSYLVTLNNMHGFPKSQSRFSGLLGASNSMLVEKATYDYGMPSDTLYSYTAHDRALRGRHPIDVVDLIVERRRMKEESSTSFLDLQVQVAYPLPPAPPIIIPGGGFQASRLSHETTTHVAVKTVSYAPFLRRTIRYAEGRSDTSVIDAFDHRTGSPAVVSGHDAYNGATYNASTVPSSRHVGTITSVTDLAFTYYPELGKKSDRYGLLFGGNHFVPLVGGTDVVSLGPSTVEVERKSAPSFDLNVAVDPSSRREYFRTRFQHGDLIQIGSKNGTISCVASVTGVSLTDDVLSIEFNIREGSLPSSSLQDVTIKIADPCQKNLLTLPLQNRVYYGWHGDVHKAHARKLFEWSWLANNFTFALRGNISNINLKYGASIKYDDGLNLFNNVGGPGTDLDDFGGAQGATNQGDSKYHQTMWYEPGANTARWGFREPSAGGIPGHLLCETPRIQQRTTTSGQEFFYFYDYSSSTNECWVNSWMRFPGIPSSGSLNDRYLEAAPFDLWRKFMIGDKLAFHQGTFEQLPGLSTMGAVKLRIGEVSDYQCVPTTTQQLSQSVTVYAKLQPVSTPTTPTPEHMMWTPVASLVYESDDVVNGSGVSGNALVATLESHSRTGTYVPSLLSATTLLGTPSDGNPNVVVSHTNPSNPREGFFRGALVKSINEHGAPVEVEYPDGSISTTQYSMKGRVVSAVFGYADGNLGWFGGDGYDDAGPVHTGRLAHSLAEGVLTVERPASMASSVQHTDQVLVRCWIRPDDANANVINRIMINGSPIAVDDSIACVDGWRLIEKSYVTMGNEVDFERMPSAGTLTYRIDDVIVSGEATETQCIVYDDDYRPLAVLGSDHFASQILYRPNGTTAGLSTETSSGVTSRAFSRVNIPGLPRTIAGAYISAPIQSLEQFVPNELIGFGQPPMPMIGAPPVGFGASGDILDVNVSTDGVKKEGILPKLLLPKTEPTKKNESGDEKR